MTEGRRPIGLTQVRALKPGKPIWDTTVIGFGARRQTEGGAVSFVLKYRRPDGGQGFETLGKLGVLTPDTARQKARKFLAEVALGADPIAARRKAKTAVSMNTLFDMYWGAASSGTLLTRKGRPKAAATLASDKARIEHLRVALGPMAVADVTPQHVERALHMIGNGKTAARRSKVHASHRRGGKGAATRSVGLLSAVFSWAIKRGYHDTNPARGVQVFAYNTRERRLSEDEYKSLGAALARAAEDGSIAKPALLAIWFLSLTGWRSGEALGLRWNMVDFTRRTVILPTSKTGRSVRPLSHPALAVLRNLPRTADDAPAFPGIGDFRRRFNNVLKNAGLPYGKGKITPHTLRHSFASVGADLGLSEWTIAALLGHARSSVTSRYMHGADAPTLAAADGVAREVLRQMRELPSAEVVPFAGAAIA